MYSKHLLKEDYVKEGLLSFKNILKYLRKSERYGKLFSDIIVVEIENGTIHVAGSTTTANRGYLVINGHVTPLLTADRYDDKNYNY